MISIIVPVLNEEKGIGSLLSYLHQNAQTPNDIELIVVDGGSSDATIANVNAYMGTIPGLALHTSGKGRARQMNAGARHAKGDILYFLHADSYPPRHYDHHIRAQINSGNSAGCFRMKFDSGHWWLRLAGWLTRFRWRACRGGDQSLFISKRLFEEIGGYNESYIIYEDNILINELYSREQFVVIPQWLTSSARKYRNNGICSLQYHFWMIYIKKWLGASPEALHRYYKKHIVS